LITRARAGGRRTGEAKLVGVAEAFSAAGICSCCVDGSGNFGWGGRTQPDANQVAQQNDAQIEQDLPVLENYDVLTNFEPLSDLSQGTQADDSNQQDTDSDSQNM